MPRFRIRHVEASSKLTCRHPPPTSQWHSPNASLVPQSTNSQPGKEHVWSPFQWSSTTDAASQDTSPPRGTSLSPRLGKGMLNSTESTTIISPNKAHVDGYHMTTFRRGAPTIQALEHFTGAASARSNQSKRQTCTTTAASKLVAHRRLDRAQLLHKCSSGQNLLHCIGWGFRTFPGLHPRHDRQSETPLTRRKILQNKHKRPLHTHTSSLSNFKSLKITPSLLLTSNNEYYTW